MMKSLLDQDSYVPHFSGHETFPLRQMWLKKAFEARSVAASVPKARFNEDAAIARFGVGKNMVASIRHWALACGVFDEVPDEKDTFRIDPLWGSILEPHGLDPYCEKTATTWLAHWRLCGLPNGKHRSTTWWWIFNNMLAPSFTREDVVSQLMDYCAFRGIKVSEATIKRDVEACVRCYVSKDEASVEDVVESMFVELSILKEEARGTFGFTRGPNISLPNGILDLAIYEYWNFMQAESTLSFDLLAHGLGSPGRVFKIDESSLAERLASISERTSGYVFWSDTAGVRQLQRRDINTSIDRKTYQRFLEAAYE